jgi:hypothetical protein
MTDLRPIYYREARERLHGNRLAIYDLLLGHGPSTAKELATACGWEVTSVRPRLTELRQICHVVETGDRRHGEHVFRALPAAEARALLESQQPAPVAPTVTPARVADAARTLGRYAQQKRTLTETPQETQLELLSA